MATRAADFLGTFVRASIHTSALPRCHYGPVQAGPSRPPHCFTGTLPSFYYYPGILLRIQRRFPLRFFAVEAYHITPHTFIFYLVNLPWHILGYHSATRRLRSMGGVMSTSLWWCCWRLLRFRARIDAGSLLCNHGHSRWRKTAQKWYVLPCAMLYRCDKCM